MSISNPDINFHSSQAKMLCDDVIKRAAAVSADSRQKQRREKGECKTCFYIRSRIGGQTITSSTCVSCSDEIINGSTCVDMICKKCSKKHHLCRHCGGDLGMRIRNKREGISMSTPARRPAGLKGPAILPPRKSSEEKK